MATSEIANTPSKLKPTKTNSSMSKLSPPQPSRFQADLYCSSPVAGTTSPSHSTRASSQSSSESSSSTIIHEQTPFAQFSLQVRELCQSLWPPPPKQSSPGRLRGGSSGRLVGMLRSRRPLPSFVSEDYAVERLEGGTFNRITAVVVPSPNTAHPLQLILRTPRIEWNSRPDRDVAILRYVRKYTSIPVAEVKALDFTSDNPLKRPYVFQTRVPGYNLQKVYPNLLHHHNCTVAREVGKIIVALRGVNSRVPGLIESASGNDDSFTIRPFDIRLRSDREWNWKPQDHESWTPDKHEKLYGTTVDLLITQFGRWRAYELRKDPSSMASWDYQHRFVDVAQAMNRLGIFGDSENCLCHLDFAARNIMVDVLPMDEPLTISGALDWDSAIFAPRFVACAPPWWVWADDREEDGADWDEQDETRALAVPPTLHGQELKRIFEETVGDEYLRFAYEPQYRQARKLFYFAVNGLHQNEDITEADKLLVEWKDLYDNWMQQVMDDIFEGSEDRSLGDGAQENGALPTIDTLGETLSFEQEMARLI